MSACLQPIEPGPASLADERVVIAFGARGCPTTAERRSELGDEEIALLNRLRWLSLKSRLAPRPEIERACYLLAGKGQRAVEPVANALFRGLARYGSRQLEFYRPGTRHPSSDEIWLLRALAAFDAGREKEGAALIAWRIRPEGRRWLRFLAAALAELVMADHAVMTEQRAVSERSDSIHG